ncbi:hypothetical protein [Pseudonocardia broussonetiae]|uniref:Uncharacterized protein n=1 Tax=Pseudonocardia broussonetiae TaxID=2736640 RepID=A0A6M6JD89_9PSEU|nr:hypothetical protein [Pseudonocardia broussonetiae]QJY44802.1 hypothetical protein HOP40_02230 [Pseudonocardia broussonetiae]
MSSVLMHLDEALERVIRLRERLLADPFAEARAERLALLFESEARAWSQLFELTRLRPVWRAALAAELLARQQAARWRERAAVERAIRVHPPEDVSAVRSLAHIGQG